MGSLLRETVATSLSDGSVDALRDAAPSLFAALSQDDLREMAESGAIAWSGTDLVAGFLQLFEYLNAEMQRVASLIALVLGEEGSTSVLSGFLRLFASLLEADARTVLTGSGAESLSFESASSSFLDALRKEFGWFFDALPTTPLGESYLLQQMLTSLAGSRVLRMAQAKQEFELAFIGSLLSAESLGSVFSENLAELQVRSSQLVDLAAGGAIVGTIAFSIGTIYQIIYDIIDTFIQIITYGAQGIGYLYGVAKDTLMEEPADALAPAADSVIADLFPPFDVATFLSEDLPTLVAEIESVVSEIIEDFIDHASEYGESAAEHLTKALGSATSTMFDALFEPYDESASLLDRMLYVIEQWFRVGTTLGPLLVDIGLLVCSGGSSGVVSAATKLGKLDKAWSTIVSTARSIEAVKKLPAYARIAGIFARNAKLTTTITKVFDRLWNAVGPAADQVKDMIDAMYDANPGAADWPDALEVAQWIDKWYDRASTINFFVGILVLLSAQGEVDSDGNVVVSDG
jgi:hypothetical protein